MTKWQIFVEYVLKNKVISVVSPTFSSMPCVLVLTSWSTVYAFQERNSLKRWRFRALRCLKLVRWSVRCCGAGSRPGERSPWPGGLHRAGADYRHARCDQHASNQYIYLASLFALGFLAFGPQLLIGVAAVGFVPKKAIGAADGIKGTFAYLIGDSFAKLGLG